MDTNGQSYFMTLVGCLSFFSVAASTIELERHKDCSWGFALGVYCLTKISMETSSCFFILLFY